MEAEAAEIAKLLKMAEEEAKKEADRKASEGADTRAEEARDTLAGFLADQARAQLHPRDN